MPWVTPAELLTHNKGLSEGHTWNPESRPSKRHKPLKHAGLEYVIPRGRRKDTVVDELPGPSFDQVCNCTKSGCNLTFGQRSDIYTQFRRLDGNAQNKYIADCQEIKKPKERKVPAAESYRKKNSYKISVKYAGYRHEVCQTMFKDMFCITAKKIEYRRTEMKKANEDHTDKRGTKSGNQHQQLTEELKQRIRDHINSFPLEESHYCREVRQEAPRYLGQDMSLKGMWRGFNARQELDGRAPIGQDTYRNIFKKEFSNLKFKRPKTDTCDLCDEYEGDMKRAGARERAQLLREKNEHIRKAKAAMKEYHDDKITVTNTENVHMITIDMQKVLFVPMLTCTSAFFKRTLSTFNVGVNVAKTKQGCMHTWDETVAHHCSPDVISCVWLYILRNFDVLAPNVQRELIIWTDRCVGQFNNQFFLRFLKYLVDRGYFTKVTHKFFVTGHSYNDCDRDFGVIEKKLKVVKPNIPAEVCAAIEESRVNNKFVVTRMQQENFLDFKKLENFSKLPRNFQVTQNLVYEFVKGKPDILFAKQHHLVREFEKLHIVNRVSSGPAYNNLDRLYYEPLLLTESKAADLRVLMGKLGRVAYNFFNRITRHFRAG